MRGNARLRRSRVSTIHLCAGHRSLSEGGRACGDHYHPWNDEQGQSPFVWSVIGAISQACSLPVTTALTCPNHAHRLCSNSGVPGELAQVLPSLQHFEQVSTLVTRESTAQSVLCGNDVGEHRDGFAPYADAGFDEVYVANMGPKYREMIACYGEHVLPGLR